MASRAGVVGVFGKTNVGKSTFINNLIGKKVVIVSDRPQTTRNSIRCILTGPEGQVVFVDTPGLHQPVNKLSAYLQRQALRALAGLDLLLYMTEPSGGVDPEDLPFLERIRAVPCPKVLIVNKMDLARGNALEETLLVHERLGLFAELVPVSALKVKNLDRALQVILNLLPEGPPLYEGGTLTDRPVEFVIAEIIREKIFQLTFQEVPYSTAVVVERIEERPSPPLVTIFATIVTAKDSQKGILIGSGGSKLKEIGRAARVEMEQLLGRKVFLSLHVRVREKWTEDPREIAALVEG